MMMGMARSDDPELPLTFHPMSNGEYAPLPRSPLIDETIRRTLDLADTNARRLGVDRRTFLRRATGTAATLVTLAACNSEQRSGATTSSSTTSSSSTSTTGVAPVGTGGTFELPPESTIEEEAATSVLEAPPGDLIVDVQTHFLDLPAGATGGGFARFPQASCGGTAAECFGTDAWLSLVLEGSDTTVAVLSAIPVVADPDPLSTALMEEARRQAERVGCLDRVLIQGHATPTIGSLQAALDAMSATAAAHDISAWKAYTHEGPVWRLDDSIGTAFCNHVRDLGHSIICVHKGLGPEAASPVDVGPAAAAHPDLAFCVYHSGFEARVVEGPYPGVDEGEIAGGVDRLIASAERAGIGAGANIYPELGSTWWNLIQRPDEAAHVLGKLLVAFGPDNILWGTDSLWYGSPQGQIDAFRAFQITPEFRDRYGYPKLTPAIKAKILGLNAARLYGIDTEITNCQPPGEDRAGIRREYNSSGVHGPTTRREAIKVFAADHPWFRR